ncbi:MAG: glycosyltransferase, partial [Panacagrimonas sp.]
MHIVHICVSSLTVPPRGYGGTERLVFWLAREQQRMGLQVSVLAHPDSEIAALLPGVTLIPCDRHEDTRPRIPKNADVLHLHRMPEGGRQPEYPYVITEHGLRKPGAAFFANTVFVSAAHAQLHGSNSYIDNGVPVEDYPCVAVKSDYFLFMARMEWPRKNARTALDLCVDSDIPLAITGSRAPWRDRRTWGRWMLHPWQTQRLVRPYPYLDGAAKLDLLTNSFALFHIVNWHEPFSLIVHEALACGTPVLASPNGALVDFVIKDHNGAQIRSYAEALESLRAMSKLDLNARRDLA